jgi:hypothetical protein
MLQPRLRYTALVKITKLVCSTFISLALVLISAANAEDSQTSVNEILRKHFEAMGGLNNWNRIESIQMNGTIERDGQTVDIVIVKKRPDQIRATVTVPIPGKENEAFQIIRAHDGKTAWTATAWPAFRRFRRKNSLPKPPPNS